MSKYEGQSGLDDIPPRHKRSRRDNDNRDDSRYDRHDYSSQNRSRSGDDHTRKRRSLSPRHSDDEHRQRRRESYRNDKPSRRHDSHRHTSRSRSPKPFQRARGPLPSQISAYNKDTNTSTPIVEKEKPNWRPTGRLAAAANTVQTAGQNIVLKYHEPQEARKPPIKTPWRMYVFKDDEIIDTVELFEQSCWLFGRELAVADIPLEHPSCSKQHAVLQFRYIDKRNEFGDKVGKVKPYALDLESSHGTFVNGERIPEAKYVELRDKDTIKFGRSRREYVLQLPTGDEAPS